MRLLLTSAGITNPSILGSLQRLLPKPIAECHALVVPTASYASTGGMTRARQLIAGLEPRTPMTEVGWGSVGVLELTAMPAMGREVWEPQLAAADALLVGGGDPLFLAHWMRESGLAAHLPLLLTDTVYVGLSAGSMVLAPAIGRDFVGWEQPDGTDRTLGVVPFAMFPHLDHPMLTENTSAAARAWAADLGFPSYAIDDSTAIVFDDSGASVVSEGAFLHFDHPL